MIDCINTNIQLMDNQIPYPVWNASLEPFQWRDMDFFAKDEFSYVAKKSSVRSAGLGALHCSFKIGQTATFNLSNSLHKLCHSGVNYTDFTRSQLIDTCEYIADKINLPFQDAMLYGRFEYAVNIEVDDPKAIYIPQIRYGNHLPTPMKHKKKQYGTKFELSYDVKTYAPLDILDKYKSTKPPNDKKYIRFEIVNKPWYLRNKGIKMKQVKDLFEKDTLLKLGESLYEKAKKIQLKPYLPDDLDYRDLEIIYFFQNATPQQLKHFRKHNQRTYYRKYKVYKKLNKQFKNEQIDISEKVKSKWMELMES